MAIYNATLKDREGTWTFASVDGELWLSVSRQIKNEEEDRLQSLLRGDGSATVPMRVTRGFLELCGRREGAQVVFH